MSGSSARFRHSRPVVLILACCLLLAISGCNNNPYPEPEEGEKVYYGVMSSGGLKGLDPCQAGDTTSGTWVAQFYDALYEYHYLNRPYKLQPALAEGMPEVSEDGLTWTIRMKKGVTYHDDPCFEATGGEGREAVAADIVYSIKRTADPANSPRWWWMLAGKIKGLDEFHARALEAQAQGVKMDYDMAVSGLKAVDDHTLVITLNERFPQFKYVLAMSFTAAVPREAVEYYGRDFVTHPVGTGPFMLQEWTRRWRLIAVRNPDYRDDRYPGEGEDGDRDAGLLDAEGERLPFLDKIYITAVAEGQPAWIYFLQGYRDMSGIGKDNFDQAITPAQDLTEDFEEKGITLHKSAQPGVYYTGFNMEDPVVGGYTEEKRKLRQAMSLAHDTDWRIRVLMNGRGVNAQSIIPPGIYGYDAGFKNPYKQHNLEKARELLAEAGWPGGVNKETDERLVVEYDFAAAGPSAEQSTQVFVNDMKEIGVEIKVNTNTWPEFLRKIHSRRTQMFGGSGWVLDYPDPENFLQLFYGPNKAPGSNSTNYEREEYDRMFEQVRYMANGPERMELIEQMRAMITEDCPVIFDTHPIDYTLRHQWLKNFKPHGITGGYLKYYDLDVELRSELRDEWNDPNYMPIAVLFGMVVVVGVVLATVRKGYAG